MRFGVLPRNGNFAKGGEPGRLPVLESILEGGEDGKENFNFNRDNGFVNN